jgi:hypothetical protein
MVAGHYEFLREIKSTHAGQHTLPQPRRREYPILLRMLATLPMHYVLAQVKSGGNTLHSAALFFSRSTVRLE